ncbi:MAG: glycosyltransferase family 4 protein, partial [Solobacterium sp.]|nr:glycosyltransferase family 4 protein [Solobacterium sp.]
TTHGTDLMGYDKWPALRRYAEEAIQACDAVISISKDNSTMLKARFPGCADRITLLRTGYDPAVFYPEKLTRKEVLGRYWIDASEYENKRIVTYAGKLTWFKGVDILLEAIRLYEDRDPASLTLIVGDGDERSNLQWRAKDLKLKSVRFLDNVDQQELRRIFSITDAFLIPSRHEPFGLAALEAMGCGVPVIAADQGGLPDLVNQDVGRLIRPSDPEDLADKVTEVLKITSEEWRDRIAAYARTRYAQDSLTQELVELYRKLLP